ncbi:LysM peptidoglycan-binding domain-containing protein [Tumebacillus sp. ITR2]|uniref:LysM peptidoglycan-binding domain-containing protein n=1 Tax=Tumebacillus amylolyticus TaxID=2801339 RepID=A0ABS1JCD2_9BACL|nr:LysM domain-containing protein [Tumebacillus amylolyticus]MBL0387926.1 LysM peptidoglycan-binding domain-containing protein [Tumebacillus amylolyticus]
MHDLIIGGFTFPLLPKDSLDFDMRREIAKIKPAGAPTVYQDMGLGEKTLEINGVFDGENAWATSEEIERLMWTGSEHDLVYGSIRKRVRVESYKPKLKRDNRVTYSLHLIICFPEEEFDNLSGTGTATTGPAALAGTTAGTANGQSYTIKSGDTLWNLAQDKYGDGSKWHVIADANGITNEYALAVGQAITIPSSSTTTAPEYAGELQDIAKEAS